MKKLHLLILACTLTCVITTVSWAQTPQLEKEKTALIAADKAWSAAAGTSDLERLWSFWDDDAAILISAEYTVRGKQQIKEFTTQNRKDPNFSIEWTVEGADVSASGDMGFTYGVGMVSRSGENGTIVKTTNPYLVVWKKNPAGEWKCIIEN